MSKSWPAGITAPLTVDNEYNHSGLIVVLTAFTLVLFIVAIAARINSSSQKASFQPDDFAFAALVTAAFIQVSLVFGQVHYGWGTRMKSIDAGSKEQMLKVELTCNGMIKDYTLTLPKLGYAADIFAVITLGLSKVTTCLFYEGLFSQMQRRFIRSILLSVTVWTVLAVLLLAIRCTSKPWNDIDTAQCSGLLARWEAVTVIDVITEVLLLVFAGLAISKVKISTKKRIIVFCALESRILLIPMSAVRAHLVKIQLESTDPTLSGSYATAITEIYLALSVTCLLTAFAKSFIAVYEDENGISYRYREPTTKSDSKGTSQLGSRSGMTRSKDTISRRFSRRGERTEHLKGWEREEDPIIGQAESGHGLQILRTVQLSVRNESIELSERGGSSL
ncbi:uncharacterized protein N7503_008054 [Penicillium pulvis]|uniref:uncharacterized protein n=1 Tax=Penicillium pulvis TaxID=1562058 RepID=UPI002547D493|nr:uncharacterized protein N7503_008054 [Penicillium pulvis]KAJ5792076.1 hypothetical protein N7503_008054 [Penicillium pulvis]